MFIPVEDVVVALKERGFIVNKEARSLYTRAHPVWFRYGRFDLNTYKQMHTVARLHGMEEIMPPADLVRGFSARVMSPEAHAFAEIMLDETAMRLAKELQGRKDLPGYEEMNKLRGAESLRGVDLTAPFLEALRVNRVGPWLDSLAPTNLTYRSVMQFHSTLKAAQDRQMGKATLGYMRREIELPQDNIIVINLAAQELDARIGGKTLTSPVIIGKPETPTAAFVRDVEHVWGQKTWYVPTAKKQEFGATSIPPGLDNMLGEAFFKTTRGLAGGAHVHGYAMSQADLFRHDVRAFTDGNIAVQYIHNLIAATLAPDAALSLGYRSNDRLMVRLGAPGEKGRWAYSELNNSRLATIEGLKIAAVHRPLFLREGRYLINSSDPYGLYAHYTSPYHFPGTFGSLPG